MSTDKSEDKGGKVCERLRVRKELGRRESEREREREGGGD